MKKLLIIAFLIFVSTLGYSQEQLRNNHVSDTTDQFGWNVYKPTKCLFSFISKYEDNFPAVIDYMESFGIKVIATCDDEKLILVELTEKYKDPTVLFRKIERAYEGKCYYKSNADVIILYDNCYDIYIKENLKE